MWTGFPASHLVLMDGAGRTLATLPDRSHGRTAFRDPPGGRQGTGQSDLMPYFSSSRDRLYYLVGESEVHSLAVGGAPQLVKRLPVGTLEHAGFAVSPDDRTIAVAIIDYSLTPHRLRVYTEDVADSAGHHELFTSTDRYEWPIAFLGDDLLMAVGPSGSQSGCGDPYCALYGYRLLGADGTFLRSFCAPPVDVAAGGYGTNLGPITPDGTVCSVGARLVEQRWTGDRVGLPYLCGQYPLPSPTRDLFFCGGPSNTLDVVDSGGHVRRTVTVTPGVGTNGPYTWLDDDHLVISGRIVQISTGASVDIGNAIFEWRVPGDAYSPATP